MEKRHNFKSLISLVLSICMILSVFGTTAVFAETENITLVIDGQAKSLSKAIEVDGNGVVFVPMEETFGYLGVEMTQMTDGTYKGFGNNGEIIIDLTKDTAEVDWVDLELPGAPYVSDGEVMVPAYLIEDAVKTEPAVFDAENGTLLVTSPDPDDEYYGGADIGKILETLPGGQVVVNQDDLMDLGGGSGLTVKKNVSVEIDGETKEALQLKTNSRTTGTYYMPTKGKQDISKGDVGVIHFKARATALGSNDLFGSVKIMYERYSDWSKVAIDNFDIKYNEWEDFYLPFNARVLGTTVSAEWPADGSQICVGVNGLSQTIQIADFEVVYFGQNATIEEVDPDYGSYHGIDEDALWRKEAHRRIEKYRKDDVAVRVVDEEGNPVEGAEIVVTQTESDFVFGTELCHDELVSLEPGNARATQLKNAIKSFNGLVCGLEMKPYKQILDDGTRGVEMANDVFGKNMRLRGHTVMWDTAGLIGFLSETGDHADLSYEELYRKLMDFIAPNVYMFKGKLFQWDVLNEPHASNHIRTTYNTTRLYTDITKLVRQIDPDVKLIVNETSLIGKNKKSDSDIVPSLSGIVRQMQSEGAQIDGVGIQAHVNDYFYPQGLYHQLDDLSQTVEEVAITEYDFIHDSQKNAGKYLADLLTAAFSHPKCKTFTIWSLSTYDDRNLGVFFDRNWNEKPAKAVWDDMVTNKFKTKMTLVSDSDGRADFRGFHGEYTITVRYDGKERKFDFGLLDNEENTIDITVGSRISANVSCGKYIEVPESMDYDSFSEAEDAYRREIGNIPYISLVLEQNLNGAISGGKILEGGSYASNSNYTSGKVWGSGSGISAIASNDSAGKGILFKNSASGTYDLSHVMSGNVFDQGNMEVSAIISTDNSRTAGFELAMGYTTAGEPVHLGTIKTTAGGYVVETLGGEQIELKDNTVYNVLFTLVPTDFPGVYDVKYTVEENCKDVIAEITEEQTLVDSFENLTGMSLKATTNGAENSGVLTLKQARVKFYAYDAPVTYQDASNVSEALYDTLRHYDTAEIVSLTDPAYLSGDKWGTADAATASDYFGYRTHSDHLYSIRTAPAGEKSVKKNIGKIESGDTVDVDFDFYIDSPKAWYNSAGYVDVRLESADGTVSRSLVKHEYSQRDYGFRVSFFGNASGAYQETQKVEYTDTVTGKGTYNRNNLHINLKLTQNSTGSYDATMTFTNELGSQKTWTIANYLTETELLKIDNFVFAGQTLAEGLKYGSGIAGIKNVVITREGIQIKDGDATLLAEGETLGIKFNNPTGKPFDAQLVLVRYAGEKFSSMKIVDFNGRRDKDGYLSIRVEKEKEDEDRFMLMLLDAHNNLKPLKSAENIVISVE